MRITDDRLAVARAVRDACTHAGNDKWMRYVRGLDLEAIIAALPEPAQDADAQAWMNAPMGKPAQEEPTPQPDPDEVRRLIARYRLAGSYLAPVFDAAAAWLRDREQQQDYSKPPAGYADRAFTDAEWVRAYNRMCRERDDALTQVEQLTAQEANVALLVAMRNALPALLDAADENARLREVVEAAKEVCDNIADHRRHNQGDCTMCDLRAALARLEKP